MSINTFDQKFGRHRFFYLMISQILWFILFPFLVGPGIKQVILNLLTSTIVLFGIFAVSFHRRKIAAALVFGIPWFMTTWIDALVSPLPTFIIFIANLFLVFFLAFTVLVLLLFIIKSTAVSGDILYCAVAIYFIIGGTWSIIYILVESVHPASFVNNAAGSLQFADFIYFSYITLTTLGYGDMVPATHFAKSLSIIEAIMGVMYLAIIISRLVGLFIGKYLQVDTVQNDHLDNIS